MQLAAPSAVLQLQPTVARLVAIYRESILQNWETGIQQVQGFIQIHN
jgi:hypothetical protein